MSIGAVKQFRAAANADPVLQQECLEAADGGASALIEVGARRGYSFSAEELEQELSDVDGDSLTPFERALGGKLVPTGELTDEELELVSAGGDPGSQNGCPPQSRDSKSQV
jgi:hypothetical protein